MYQKYSMYRNDETVFSPYVLKKLCAEAKANADAGMLTLFGAMSEDAVPVAFTADVHLMADVIRAAEHSETLGQAILDAMDDAGDNGKKFNILAIWIEEQDLFAYLFCYESRVHITTVLSFKRVYFVNPYVVFLRVLKCGKTLSGYGESGRFAPSAMRKFKNAMA